MIRKIFLLLLLAPTLASAQISDAICTTWESVMIGQTLNFRQMGIPIDTAKETFNSEDSVGTRVFLKRIVQSIYQDPVNGKKYLESGKFKIDCIKIHRGY